MVGHLTPSANPTGIRPVEETSPQIHLEQRDEGGRPLPRSMAGQPRRAQRKSWFVLLLAVGLLQAPILAQAMVVDVGTPLEEGIETNFGGRSLLVEELTTTWCVSCAEIDPYLVGVADSHGSRIALMAYHPNDGQDAFAPEAAQHRIERLRANNADLPGTPTFMVEGGFYRTGTDAWVDVQRDILDEEVTRQTYTKLKFTIQQQGTMITASISGFEGHASNGSQLTFLLLEHGKEVPKDTINPGEATRDRVVIGTSECLIANNSVTTTLGLVEATASTGCTSDFSIQFEALDSFSVVLIHEQAYNSLEQREDLGSFGALEFAYRGRSVDDAWNPVWIVLATAVATGLLIFQKRETKDDK